MFPTPRTMLSTTDDDDLELTRLPCRNGVVEVNKSRRPHREPTMKFRLTLSMDEKEASKTLNTRRVRGPERGKLICRAVPRQYSSGTDYNNIVGDISERMLWWTRLGQAAFRLSPQERSTKQAERRAQKQHVITKRSNTYIPAAHEDHSSRSRIQRRRGSGRTDPTPNGKTPSRTRG